MKKINVLLISIVVLVTVVSSVWLGYYPIALVIGTFSVIIGIKLFKLAELKVGVLLLLTLQIFFLLVAFGMVYHDLGLNSVDSLTISFQCLFHISILQVPDDLGNLTLFKIAASIEGFIGYLLIVSGVALLIKSDKASIKVHF